MFLKRSSQTNKVTDCGLDVYCNKRNEPSSSVEESSDYDFATTHYNEKDFRYLFVTEYIRYLKEYYDVTIANCKFERPNVDSNFINFYIYLWEDDPDIHYRIEDKSNRFVASFYDVLKNYQLPGISKVTHIQFLVKNISLVMIGQCLDLAWRDIHDEISTIFPEVAYLSYWSNFYIFIDKDKFDIIITNLNYLEKIKKYCYEAAKKYDINNVLVYEQFRIRVDNYENYHSIGGYNYFNSNYMFDCLRF